MVNDEEPELEEGSTLHTLTVPDGATSVRLDRWLATALPHLSRARLQKLLEDGHVTILGRDGDQSQKVKPGMVVEVVEPAPVAAIPLPQDLPLTILMQDMHMVALNKAAGMVVHPAAGNPDKTLVNALLFHIKDLQGVGGELRPGIVHRLDKDTSGVMVVAKNEQALRALQSEFKERNTQKTYLALVKGNLAARTGTWKTRFGRHPSQRMKFTGTQGPKDAWTDWEVLCTTGDVSLVALTLHTGRTHQIRVHLSEAGHAILGDVLYAGRNVAALAPRQMLHAWKLSIHHPKTGKVMLLQAPVPEDFRTLAAGLGLTLPE